MGTLIAFIIIVIILAQVGFITMVIGVLKALTDVVGAIFRKRN